MRRNLFLVALVCLVLFGVGSIWLQAARAGKISDLPVTSTISDTNPVGGTSQIQNDDKGDYTNSKNVQSIIQPIGDWVLDTNYSSLSDRGVFLDFSQPVNGASPGPDPNKGLIGVKARLITQCPTYGYSMLSLANGQTVYCGLVIGFSYGGNSYRLVMNPGGVNHYTDTDTVKVTCTGVGTSGQCNQWSLTPSGVSYPGTSVAKLLMLTTVRGKSVEQDLGNFYFSFSIGIKNP